ncbi:MAG: ABC transporter ATP-binding protein [Clostridia bacterium]|nr:ABC transporter ATP-binding protein [Clostridia bacterium]
MGNVIEIQHLYKSFGEVKAVQDLSFRVKEGELFAFLGVNGAGKSTTINILCGQLRKDGGSVKINGFEPTENPEKVKRALGVVFQNSVLDKALTVYENLESRAALYGIHGRAFKDRLQELSGMLGFGDLLRRTVGKLSGGQRRRIDIARALLHRPDILILDEPTTGLDPQTRKTLWDVVDNLRKTENMTVFLTTHYMEEAADADYVVILDSGKIAAEGTPLTLKNTYTGDFITLYQVSEEEIRSFGRPYEALRDGYRVPVENTEKATQLILQHPAIFRDYEITKGKMDDVFLAVTGKNLMGGAGK